MAAVAFFSGGNVIWRLADGDDTVMTAAACSRYKTVIEDRIRPGTGIVAEITFGDGGDMFRRFAGCGKSIVAGAAGADNRSMVNPADMIESDRVMAVFTVAAAEYMSR